MTWWMRALAKMLPMRSEPMAPVQLSLSGWEEAGRQGDMLCWRDAMGDLLTLTHARGHLGPASVDQPLSWQRHCRSMAQAGGGGLIEATTAALDGEPVGTMIYKRLKVPAYVYTGMCMVPDGTWTFVWTVVAGERGTTGVREAVVTTELFNAGTLTIERFEQSWACDPYDPSYRGVDQSVLRFISDDPVYDARFPDHPLSKIRRLLPQLPGQVRPDGQRGVLD